MDRGYSLLVSISLYTRRMYVLPFFLPARAAPFSLPPLRVNFFPLRRYEEPLGDLEGLREQGEPVRPNVFLLPIMEETLFVHNTTPLFWSTIFSYLKWTSILLFTLANKVK